MTRLSGTCMGSAICILLVIYLVSRRGDSEQLEATDDPQNYNRVCFLDTIKPSQENESNKVVVERDGQLVLKCSCFSSYSLSDTSLDWSCNGAPLRECFLAASLHIDIVRGNEFDAESTMTIGKVEETVAGTGVYSVCCEVNDTSDCRHVTIGRYTFLRVFVVVEPIQIATGSYGTSSKTWPVSVNCTVETDSEYIRDNANFLLRINSKHSNVTYSHTSSWNVSANMTTSYFKQHVLRMELASGSIVECSLQDIDGMSFGTKGKTTTTFLLPFSGSPTDSYSVRTSFGVTTRGSDAESKTAAMILGIVSVIICIAIVLYLMFKYRRRTEELEVAGQQEDSNRTDTFRTITTDEDRHWQTLKSIDKKTDELLGIELDGKKERQYDINATLEEGGSLVAQPHATTNERSRRSYELAV